MANPVMNYAQFMSAFNSSDKNYRKKANVADKGKTGSAKVNQEMATGPVKGAGTPAIKKGTSKHLANIKKKSATSK